MESNTITHITAHEFMHDYIIKKYKDLINIFISRIKIYPANYKVKSNINIGNKIIERLIYPY